MKPLPPLAVFAIVLTGIPLAVFVPALALAGLRFALPLAVAASVLSLPMAALLAFHAKLERQAVGQHPTLAVKQDKSRECL